MPNYTEILERLKQARGESFELDVAIAEATAGNMNPVPGYTRSLDASVSLVERVLPNWQWLARSHENGKFFANLHEYGKSPNDGHTCFPAWGPASPLAILIALFEALKAREIAPSALANRRQPAIDLDAGAMEKALADTPKNDRYPKIQAIRAYLAALPATGAGEWMPIASAPKGQKIIGGYWNRLGKWRSIMACYYPPKTLESYEEDCDEDGFAPEGWYEESETHDEIMPCPFVTHWQPLPAPPLPSPQSRV